MKILKIISILLFIVVLSACVPSLHGIVKEGEELIDDQIIGLWISKKSYDNIQVNITMEDEHGEKREFSSMNELVNYVKGDSSMNESVNYVKGDSLMDNGASWLIERAGNVTFEEKDGENYSSMTLDVATQSMKPDDYETVKFDSLPYYILTHKDWDEQDTITTYLVVKLTEIGGMRYMDFLPLPRGIDMWEGRFATNLIAGHTFARFEVNEQGLIIQPLDGDHIDDLISQKRVRLKHEKVDGSTILTASTDELRAFLEKYQTDKDLYDDQELLISVSD